MSNPVLKLDSGRRAFEVTTPDGTVRWEYDIVTVKLCSESLEKKHALRKEGSDKLAPATAEFLQDLAVELEKLGLVGCTTDAAFRVHQIVNAQFIAMAASVQSLVNTMLVGE